MSRLKSRPSSQLRQLVLISGLSGSGKSVALHTLEDMGYYCVDNLPITLLAHFVALDQLWVYQQVAIGINTHALPNATALMHQLQELAASGIQTHRIYLETRDAVLMQRFAETRRSHPFTEHTRTLEEAIAYERALLADMSALSHRIDTSLLSAQALQQCIRQCVAQPTQPLNLLFESFGFKYGVPQDADFLFDVRCLPSPHYMEALRDYTGLAAPIIRYFEDQTVVRELIEDLTHYLEKWLPQFMQSTRSYLTIAIGCTGGKHRSVYVAEALAKKFAHYAPLTRHRQLLPNEP